MSFQSTWRCQQFYGNEPHPSWTSTSLLCWDSPLQSRSGNLANLNTSLLWPCHQWILDQLFVLMIWHTILWFFVDAVARWLWDEDFPYPKGVSFAYSSNHWTEIGFYHWTRLCVHWWNHFQVPQSSGLGNLSAAKCPSSFSGWHSWILYGRNPTTFVSRCNDAFDMLNCWDAYQLKVIGWFEKNAWTCSLSSVTTVDFHSDALFLASQTLPVDSNMAINL